MFRDHEHGPFGDEQYSPVQAMATEITAVAR